MTAVEFIKSYFIKYILIIRALFMLSIYPLRIITQTLDIYVYLTIYF